VVTQLAPLRRFWPAEDYHQDFARLNPDHPYIRYWDAPKLVDLQQRLPALYRAEGLASR
jgi:peptide-methionine (S)-S-oxide reductase